MTEDEKTKALMEEEHKIISGYIAKLSESKFLLKEKDQSETRKIVNSQFRKFQNLG